VPTRAISRRKANRFSPEKKRIARARLEDGHGSLAGQARSSVSLGAGRPQRLHRRLHLTPKRNLGRDAALHKVCSPFGRHTFGERDLFLARLPRKDQLEVQMLMYRR